MLALKNWLRNNFKPLAILVTTLLAYGQTLLMYFWQDDFALLFKLQHQAGPAGSFGSGIIGQGAYKYLVAFFVPFFPFFGTNSFLYFLIGLLSYFAVIYCFYLLVKKIFHSDSDSFAATLIFASGYIGSDIMFRIINSWQTNLGLVLALLSFNFFFSAVTNQETKNRIKYYLLSLIFFFAAVEFVYVRSHSLVFVFLAFDLIYFAGVFNFKKIAGLLVRQIPFWAIFYLRYVKDVPSGQGGLKAFFAATFAGKAEYLAGLVGTTGNALVPDFYQTKTLSFFPSSYNLIIILVFLSVALFFSKLLKFNSWQKLGLIIGLPILYFLNRAVFAKQAYWYNDPHSFVSASVGLYLTWFIILFSFFLWRRKSSLAKTILLGYLFLASQIFGYFIQYPETVFSTTHRYLSYASIGYAIVFAGVSGLIKEANKKYYVLVVSALIFSNLVLGFTYQNRLVRERSIPTRNFYQNLLKLEPKINKDAVFYFDVENNAFIQNQFDNFFAVGSMPNSTAIAVWYGIDRYDLRLVTNYDEFLFNLAQTKNLDNIFTFYYGANGPTDTTKSFRAALSGSGNKFTGSMAEFNVTGSLKIDTSACGSIKTDPNLKAYLDYLSARESYYRVVKATSLSEWSGEEVKNAVDNDPSTDWRGHRIYWHDHENEKLTLDIGKVESINKFVWVNTNKLLSPTEYEILTSTDGTVWQKAKSVTLAEAKNNGEETIDDFGPVNARFVQMNIKHTLSDDSPAISEAEVIGSRFDLNTIRNVRRMLSEPNSFMDACTFAKYLPVLGKYLKVKADIKTDKGISQTTITLDNFVNDQFNFIAVPGGTEFKTVEFDFGKLPVSYQVRSIDFRNLTFSEISKLNLIKTFSQN